MLILTRNRGKAFLVGDDVTVTVLSVKGQRVRLGIEAPREISVDCVEVRERRLSESLYTQENTHQHEMPEAA